MVEDSRKQGRPIACLVLLRLSSRYYAPDAKKETRSTTRFTAVWIMVFAGKETQHPDEVLEDICIYIYMYIYIYIYTNVAVLGPRASGVRLRSLPRSVPPPAAALGLCNAPPMLLDAAAAAASWLLQRSCNAAATFLQRSCNAAATLLQRSCNAPATLLQCSQTTFRPVQLLQDDASTCPAAPGPSFSNNNQSIIAVFETNSPALDLNAWRSIRLCQCSIWKGS